MLRVVAICAVALVCHLIVAADSDILYDYDLKNETSIEEYTTIQSETEAKSTDEVEGRRGRKLSVCSPPPDIDGVVSPVLERREYPVGFMISYQCKFGYVSRSSGSLLSICVKDTHSGKAEWTHPNTTCIPRSCGDPGYVVNGRRIGNLFTFPNNVKFECLEGYKLQGLKDRYCQANGEWSGKLPTCIPIRCPIPSNPKNGKVLYSSLDYGTELVYECDKGFSLQNHQTRICIENGIWSNDEPECTEKSCRVPESPEYGRIVLSDEQPKVGTLAFYSCEDGTTLVGASTSKCLSTGDWTFEEPKCARSCSVSAVQDGALGRFVRTGKRTQTFVALKLGELAKHHEKAILLCRDGYSPTNGTSERRKEVECDDGTWSNPLQCHSMSCNGQPPPAENASPVIENRDHGKVIWYKCDPGFEKIKDGRVVCNYGRWEGRTPICGDYKCHMNELNYPGLIKPQVDFKHHGDFFTVECEKGYKESSLSKQITCYQGNWDISANPCTLKTCEEEPPSLRNGKAREFTRDNGSVVDYACFKGYQMIGHSSVYCAYGEWYGQPPSCEPSTVVGTTTLAKESNNNVTGKPSNRFPSSFQTEDCFCTYDYNKELLVAFRGDESIENHDQIKKGEKVRFFCKYAGLDIIWPNGLQFYEQMELVCDKCRNWQMNELPDCKTRVPGDSFLLYDPQLKLLPGGIIEVPRSERISFKCINPWAQPRWNVTHGERIEFQENSVIVDRSRFFGEDIIIDGVDHKHIGRYECFAIHDNAKLGSVVLDLNVAEIEVLCPELSTETNQGSFEIVYSNERKVHSSARYTCKDPLKKTTGPRERFCLENGKWSNSFPACEEYDALCPPLSTETSLGSFEIVYSNGGNVHSTASYTCKDPLKKITGSSDRVCRENGKWSFQTPICEDIRCPILNENEVFFIVYTNSRKVNSIAVYFCKAIRQNLIGSSNRTCLHSGEWSGTSPVCEDVTCPTFPLYNGLTVTYTNGRKVGSIASFRCLNPASLVGSPSARCGYNGTWNHPRPSCEMLEIHCPKIDGKDIFSIKYSNSRRVNSTAQFFCKGSKQKVAGCNFMTCQPNGEWSGDYPTCVDYVTCDQFAAVPNINVSYTDGGRVGSHALFDCLPATILVGRSHATCRSNGTWSHSLPRCAAPNCSIEELEQSLPDSVHPILENVTSEFVTPGLQIPLICEDYLVLSGSKNVVCNLQGKWEFKDVQCISACQVDKDESSLLIVEPIQDHYRIGEYILLSCPPGQKLNSDVERMMCLGRLWSNPLPDCVEVTEADRSGFRQTTLKSA